jgi:oligosaccharide repeat unit polymerase
VLSRTVATARLRAGGAGRRRYSHIGRLETLRSISGGGRSGSWDKTKYSPLRHYASLAGAVVLLILIVVCRVWLIALPTKTLSAIASAIGVAAIVVISRAFPRSNWSMPAVCITILALFHLGALPELSLGEKSSLQWTNDWIFTPLGSKAIWAGLVGVVSCTVGALFGGFFGSSDHPEIEQNADEKWSKSLSLTGCALVCAGLAGWLYFAFKAGLTPGSSYLYYLGIKQIFPLQLVFYLFGVGFPWACIKTDWAPSKVAIAVFVAFGLFAFPIGLRGEVLFPLAAAAAILAFKHRLPKGPLTLVLATVLLAAIAAISATRAKGLSNVQLAFADFSPLKAMAELGSSLRVVASVISWQLARGEHQYYGSTYLYPLLDSFRRYILFVPFPPENQRFFFNAVIADRVGTIGGSMIGEAILNFGYPGMIVIMFLAGLALARLNVIAKGPRLMAVAGVFMFMFMVHVRNGFADLPLILLLGLCGSALAWVIATSVGNGSIAERQR